MIEDGKPAHWPKMFEGPYDFGDQSLIRCINQLRRMIVDYRKRADDDWRVHHAREDHIINVVAGLIADAEAMDALYDAADKVAEPLRKKIESLEEQLAESKRPFTAQMEMQNRRIIALTAELDQIKETLKGMQC